jgi:hypothetical protein
MKTADIKNKVVDDFFSMLKHLSTHEKLELMARLNKAIKAPQPENKLDWEKLYGSFQLDRSADEFLAELKKDRSFTRKSLEL